MMTIRLIVVFGGSHVSSHAARMAPVHVGERFNDLRRNDEIRRSLKKQGTMNRT